MKDYSRLRHPINEIVVSRMDPLTALARGRPKWVGLLRHYLIPTMADVWPLTRIMRDFLTGLDHPNTLSGGPMNTKMVNLSFSAVLMLVLRRVRISLGPSLRSLSRWAASSRVDFRSKS
jgi:hypothetical protein